jgi:hypothetical protein
VELEMSSPETIRVAFYQNKKIINETSKSQGHIQKGLSVCTTHDVVSPDPLSPTPPISLAMKTPQHTEEVLAGLCVIIQFK